MTKPRVTPDYQISYKPWTIVCQILSEKKILAIDLSSHWLRCLMSHAAQGRRHNNAVKLHTARAVRFNDQWLAYSPNVNKVGLGRE